MTSKADLMRDVTARALRAVPWLPQHRGIRRRLNDYFLRAGASPVAVAPLQQGVRATIDLRSFSQRDAFYLGHYDSDLIASCARLLTEGCVMMDVGANIGLTLLPLAPTVKQLRGSIHAFEPVPENLERLRGNVTLNRLDTLVQIWPFGLSSEDGQAQIVLREDFAAGGQTGNAAIAIDATDDRFAKQTIELRSLDSFVTTTFPLSRLDLAKVDIEGHEDFFLAGARATLTRLRPIVMMEVNKTYWARRSVNLDERLRETVPDYQMLVSEGGNYCAWRASATINDCKRLDNVFLVPRESCSEALAKLNIRA